MAVALFPFYKAFRPYLPVKTLLSFRMNLLGGQAGIQVSPALWQEELSTRRFFQKNKKRDAYAVSRQYLITGIVDLDPVAIGVLEVDLLDAIDPGSYRFGRARQIGIGNLVFVQVSNKILDRPDAEA